MTDVELPKTEDSLFSFLASLRMTLGTVAEEVKAARNQRAEFERQARLAASPFYVPFAGAAICPNPSIPFVVDMNLRGPVQGHVWHVRKLAVGGVSPTTAAAGRLDVYVTSAGVVTSALTLAQIGMQDWQDQATSLPLIANYGDGELVVKGGERLLLVITNGTAGQQYVVNGKAKDIQEAIIPPGGQS